MSIICHEWCPAAVVAAGWVARGQEALPTERSPVMRHTRFSGRGKFRSASSVMAVAMRVHSVPAATTTTFRDIPGTARLLLG